MSLTLKKYLTLMFVATALHLFTNLPFPGPPAARAEEEGSASLSASPTATVTAPTSTTAAPSQAAGPPAAKAKEKTPLFVDLLHGGITSRLRSTATWFDSFFSDERYLAEQNKSYIRFTTDVFQEDRASLYFRPRVNVRIALPQLEKKTHLVFSADQAQAVDPANAPAQTASQQFRTAEEQNLTTSVHYIFRSSKKESFIVRTGLQFHKLSPVVLFAPRYRSLFAFGVWDFRFTQEVVWRSAGTPWQTDTRFDFERLLPREFFFRTSVDGVWFSDTRGYFYSLSAMLRQPLDRTHALEYEWINSYQTRPTNELSQVAFLVRYRHSFLREWLFFELSPQVRFPRDRNFNAVPGILFRFEMFFGGV